MEIASVKVTPNSVQRTKWYQNLLIFLAPVGVIYLSAIAGLLQVSNHIFSLADFFPSEFTWGAIVLYLVNGALDYLRKVQASK